MIDCLYIPALILEQLTSFQLEISILSKSVTIVTIISIDSNNNNNI